MLAEEHKALIHFKRNKPFKIIQCDKNVDCMLISEDNFNKLAYEHLNNLATYKPLNEDISIRIVNEINDKLKELECNGNISEVLFKSLSINANHNCKAGIFRVLA